MFYDEILDAVAGTVHDIKSNMEEIKNADTLKEEFTISLDLLIHDLTCYSENIKAGEDYDKDIDFMR